MHIPTESLFCPRLPPSNMHIQTLKIGGCGTWWGAESHNIPLQLHLPIQQWVVSIGLPSLALAKFLIISCIVNLALPTLWSNLRHKKYIIFLNRVWICVWVYSKILISLCIFTHRMYFLLESVKMEDLLPFLFWSTYWSREHRWVMGGKLKRALIVRASHPEILALVRCPSQGNGEQLPRKLLRQAKGKQR